MNGWLMVEIVLVVLLCVAFLFRARLGDRFQQVSMAASGLLVAVCLVESLSDRAQPWTIGLGVAALALFALEFFRQSRRRSP